MPMSRVVTAVARRRHGGTAARRRGGTAAVRRPGGKMEHQLSGRQSKMVWQVAKLNNGLVVRSFGYVTAQIQVER